MPYTLKQTKKGYFVITEGTGRKHSNHPLSKTMAERQMRALYYNVKDAKK